MRMCKLRPLLVVALLAILAAIAPLARAQESQGRSSDRGRQGPSRQNTGPVVQMAVTPAQPTVGDRISVTVRLAGAKDVGHVPFHVNFDPEVLQFEEGEQAPFLGSDGQQTAFFAAATSSGETVVVGLSRLGRIDGVNGAGDLCVLHFTAVGAGDAAFSFARATVRDSTNRIVQSVFKPTRVIVH